MTLQILDDLEQGSEGWFAARLGIPTASKFATVMAKGEGKTRAKYMRQLAGEIITGEPAETFTNAHMERGKVMEDEARQTYAFIHDADIRRVGFVRNGNRGASPDSLIGANGGLEIKTALPDIQIERLLLDRLPSEHKAQVQGSLWITEREWWDFVSYWPRLPMLTVRVYRDEDYIKTMADEIDRFNDELAQLVERMRAFGATAEVPSKPAADVVEAASPPATDKVAIEAKWIADRKPGPRLSDLDGQTLLSVLKLGVSNSDDINDVKAFAGLHGDGIAKLPNAQYVEFRWVYLDALDRFKKAAA